VTASVQRRPVWQRSPEENDYLEGCGCGQRRYGTARKCERHSDMLLMIGGERDGHHQLWSKQEAPPEELELMPPRALRFVRLDVPVSPTEPLPRPVQYRKVGRLTDDSRIIAYMPEGS
jgi:hypothetical protein